MSKIRVTKEFRFEGAHALKDYDGKCRYIHGHSYILFVTVTGEPLSCAGNPKDGMIIDFTDLKKIVNESIINKFDHALVLNRNAVLAGEIREKYENVILTGFQPTCENLTAYFAELLNGKLPKEVKLYKLKLYETATSYVEWYACDN
ncbi:MAG: 6-carboxytetrahydropterin synthase [Bacteroidales bacterium]|jgi:6-pyruvoyltetrahydropterin/6-carboxytetrahydropterin synthase|nr:6-carboxytetrahydropterin synthase [Bacteroidales bacterium]